MMLKKINADLQKKVADLQENNAALEQIRDEAHDDLAQRLEKWLLAARLPDLPTL